MIEELAVIHASNPANQRALYLIRVSNPGLDGGHIRFAQSFYDVTATDEQGHTAVYMATGAGISKPNSGISRRHDLDIQLDNVSQFVSDAIKKAKTYQRSNDEPIWVTLLGYNSADLSKPAEALPMRLANSNYTPTKAQLRASFLDVIDRPMNTERYTPDLYPGLEYV